MKRIVAYLRVSTQRQRRSGLGIEAQRAAIARFAEAEGLTIIAEYVEAETEKGPTRSTGGLSLLPRSRPPDRPNARSWWPGWIGYRATWPLSRA